MAAAAAWRALPHGARGKNFLRRVARDEQGRYLDAITFYHADERQALLSRDVRRELEHWDAESAFRARFERLGGLPGNDDSVQAPHINVVVFARGMLVHAYTRIYFDDEAANTHDPVLLSVKNKARRKTLVAARGEREGRTVYRFDIRLQGDNETVFFDM